MNSKEDEGKTIKLSQLPKRTAEEHEVSREAKITLEYIKYGDRELVYRLKHTQNIHVAIDIAKSHLLKRKKAGTYYHADEQMAEIAGQLAWFYRPSYVTEPFISPSVSKQKETERRQEAYPIEAVQAMQTPASEEITASDAKMIATEVSLNANPRVGSGINERENIDFDDYDALQEKIDELEHSLNNPPKLKQVQEENESDWLEKQSSMLKRIRNWARRQKAK